MSQRQDLTLAPLPRGRPAGAPKRRAGRLKASDGKGSKIRGFAGWSVFDPKEVI